MCMYMKNKHNCKVLNTRTSIIESAVAFRCFAGIYLSRVWVRVISTVGAVFGVWYFANLV